MFVQPVDYFLAVWFVLAGLSTLYVGIDQYRNNPEPVVMKWGFILVTLYMGPLGLLLYVLADKEPRPGEHEAFIRPLWKQGIGSTIHCVAGDATGIILVAVITALLGLPMWLDLILEYLVGFAFGWFIFQSLFMKSLMGGTYWENVRKSFLPEFISMNFMLAGMAPVMVFLMMGGDMRAMVPTELLFWGVMSIGVTAGFILTYPCNVWLVARGLKHGLMTLRPAAPAAVPSAHVAHEAHTHAEAANEAGHGAAPLAPAAAPRAHAAGHGGHAGHGMASDATRAQVGAVSAFSIVALLLGLIVPANWLNLSLSADDVGGLIMPAGMAGSRDTSAAAMRAMAAIDPRLATQDPEAEGRGDHALPFRIENGVKVFELTASVVRWTVRPGVAVEAYAYNGRVPGPRIHVRQGDHVRIDVFNGLPERTGLYAPGMLDAGRAPATIAPGGSRSYEFTASRPGTGFYRPAVGVSRGQALGLHGALIVDPATADAPAQQDYLIQPDAWVRSGGLSFPAGGMAGIAPNLIVVNGRQAADTLHMHVGETLRLRLLGTQTVGTLAFHLSDGLLEESEHDGGAIPAAARHAVDTVRVAPGQRSVVTWTPPAPGIWVLDGPSGVVLRVEVASS
ncbi:DUF4396 domain-containing protein [Bordetella genomosp. 1]|uniref:Copper oxidase n=1 Tax=Bordetella genomosp. 1 TaxID=1395607 RepID=A0ABX4EUB5_9BORD|nr:DUF4396 domain-containing protein [Bordetella genomosp. 1]OZI57835.1 copper oxidase [Bordetella genomosp. 1]